MTDSTDPRPQAPLPRARTAPVESLHKAGMPLGAVLESGNVPAPVEAGKWRATHASPFPPVVETNGPPDFSWWTSIVRRFTNPPDEFNPHAKRRRKKVVDEPVA